MYPSSLPPSLPLFLSPLLSLFSLKAHGKIKKIGQKCNWIPRIPVGYYKSIKVTWIAVPLLLLALFLIVGYTSGIKIGSNFLIKWDIKYLGLTQRSLVSVIWWQPCKSWSLVNHIFYLYLYLYLTWKFSKENQKTSATKMIKIWS